MTLSDRDLQRANELRLRAWAKSSARYDKSMGFFERRVFGTGHRGWACSRAEGRTLEVAVGSGLNLHLYPTQLDLVGIDLSPEMLALAKQRAADAGRDVDLRTGDAHALPFEDGSFDSVVCTYSLCNIPDPHRAVAEMKRVLKPGGKLILVDHIRSAVKPLFWVQKVVEFFSVKADGDHQTRRPLEQVKANGFEIVERDRRAPGGIIERLVAVKPR